MFKITDVYVVDPRMEAKAERPYIYIEGEGNPENPNGNKIVQGGMWAEQLGPLLQFGFMPYDPRHNSITQHGCTARHFNHAFRGHFEPVVDVWVKNHRPASRWGMRLSRARKLLRQYESPYRLLVNESDAENGDRVWVPTLKVERCLFVTEGKETATCSEPVVKTVNYPKPNRYALDVDLPLCYQHLAEFNSRNARARKDA